MDASGFLVGTPSDVDIGQHEVSVQVTDVAGSTDQQTFKITVNNTNDPPLFEASAQSSLFWDPIFEGVSYELQLVANDPDTYYGDNLVYSMDQSLEWLSVGSDGKVVISADDSNIGSHYLEFIVTDSEGLIANLPWSVHIANTPEPVYVIENQSTVFHADKANTYTIEILDEDHADTYLFSFVEEEEGYLNWLSIDAKTGLLSGSPNSGTDVGNYSIPIQVTDAGGFQDTQNIQIEVISYTQNFLGSGSDKFYGTDEKEYIETGGGADYILAGGGDDLVAVSGAILVTDKNPFDGKSNFAIIDTGLGNDTVEISTDTTGTIKLISGGGDDRLVIKGEPGAFSMSASGDDVVLTAAGGTELILPNQMAYSEHNVFFIC